MGRLRGWFPGLTTVGVAASTSTALVAGTSATVVAPPVRLAAAVVTPANSTAQIFAGSTYYNQDWTTYAQPQVIPFLQGPQGIADAIDRNSGGNSKNVVLLASGWGAGQTGTALGLMQARSDPALNNVKLVILDNNSNRAGGGFWTTYAAFAPLLATSAAPTPSHLDVPVVDVAYEYNINSDAPTYPLNLLADANSLVAYIDDYGAQSTAPVPAGILANPTPGEHYVLAPNGSVVNQYKSGGKITYVTFESDGLPLLQPLRSLPGGNALADALEPVLTVLVDAGYKDNSPIPTDPSATRPLGLLPTASEATAAARQLRVAVAQGAQGAHAAQTDLPSPTGAVRNPTAGLVGQKTSVAATSVVRQALLSLPQPVTPLKDTTDTNTAHKMLPGPITPDAPSSSRARPLQKIVGGLSSALKGLAHSLNKNGVHKADTPGPAGS